jgi:hypothetical protein
LSFAEIAARREQNGNFLELFGWRCVMSADGRLRGNAQLPDVWGGGALGRNELRPLRGAAGDGGLSVVFRDDFRRVAVLSFVRGAGG